jgi:tetratricopeptide (TPR) repeat protein
MAIRDFNQIIQIDELLDVAYFNRGLSFFFLEKFELSIADFTTAIKLNDKEEDYYVYRAMSFMALSKPENGFVDFEKAIEINPLNPDIFFNRSLVYYENGNYDAALKDLESTFKCDPEYPGIFQCAHNESALSEGGLLRIRWWQAVSPDAHGWKQNRCRQLVGCLQHSPRPAGRPRR